MGLDQVNELKVLDAELAKDSMKKAYGCAKSASRPWVLIARRAADSDSKDERRRARL